MRIGERDIGSGRSPWVVAEIAGEHMGDINPANEPSRKMFEKLGFKLLQVTYALEVE